LGCEFADQRFNETVQVGDLVVEFQMRRASDFNEIRVATTGSRKPTLPGRQAALIRISCILVRLRTWSRR
jgi:hypothetical protein